MPSIKNSLARYGLVISLLHWVMAIVIIGLLACGLYMVRLPVSLEKLKFYGYHKEFGILILMLVIIRFSWRMADVIPLLPDYMPQWQKIAARCVHYLFYLLMFALPITGWLHSSASGLSVSFFGLFTLPNLISANENTRLLLAFIHKWLGWGMIGVIVLHVGATIHHYVLHKDNLLRRLWL